MRTLFTQLIVCLFVGLHTTNGQAPNLINYQGRLWKKGSVI